MRAFALTLFAALSAALVFAGCDQIDTSKSGPVVTPANPTTPPAGTRPDNTAVNQRDADMKSTKTPIDQNESQADIDTTATIRKRVLDTSGSATKDLSVNARNVKIITADGRVTLRGPVKSQAEYDTIERIAREVAGEGKVDNQLEVAPQER